MTLFIISVLVLAGMQSFCKLSLLPRKWSWGITAALFPLPFCFESAIAASSMRQVNSVLSSPATLENWCALAVIQELLVLTAGFSLLEDRQQAVPGTGVWKKALKFCKYAVFLPSLLCPAGILYLQMYLFNRFPEWDFRRLNWATVFLIAGAALCLTEGLRLFRRDRERRLLTVLHLEYFFLFPAIFLPVAATAEFVESGSSPFRLDSLLLLLFFAAATLGSASVFYFLFKIKQHRSISCQR